MNHLLYFCANVLLYIYNLNLPLKYSAVGDDTPPQTQRGLDYWVFLC